MKRSWWMTTSHYTVLIILAILCLAPIWVIFATSLRQQVDIFAEPLNFIFMPTLENYRAVIEEDKLDRYLGNSLFVGIVSTVIDARLSQRTGIAAVMRSTMNLSSTPVRAVPKAVVPKNEKSRPESYTHTVDTSATYADDDPNAAMIAGGP